MACGDIAWWRAPDFVGLLQRHGQIEHLIIQFDFLVQLARDPRAEFSIAGASKSTPGGTGFADIVANLDKEIWEIKPKHLEAVAEQEAKHYVKFATASCGPAWRPGTGYFTSPFAKTLYGAEKIVYRAEANGMRYELIAEQGKPGTVLYYWTLNGKELRALDAAMAWAVRGKIMADYFGKQVPAPIKGARAPNDIPPIKFKPPALSPDGCITPLQPGVVEMNKAIWTTCAGRIVDGGGVAVLLEEAAYNSIVGPTNVARAVESMQVQMDPQMVFARALYTALSAAGASFGVPHAVYLLWRVGKGVAVALVRNAAVAATGAGAGATATAPTAGGALGAELVAMFWTAFRGFTVRTALAAGATTLVVAVPRVSQAAPGKPVAVDLFPFKFRTLKPREMQTAKVGLSWKVDGAEHYIVGLAETGAD